MALICIIDDDPHIGETLSRVVARAGHQALTAQTLAQGLDLLRRHAVDLVFLDVKLPDGDGLQALPAIQESPAHPEVIVLTGQGTPDGAATAIHGGVWEYLVKPMSVQDILHSLDRALAHRDSHQRQAAPLRLDGVVGVSPGFRACLDQAAKAARSDAAVCIQGETGTGKELLAQTIHANSRRAGKPFVVVDCAALSESLLESLLFGHKKGAFTSASQDSLGLIRAADQGALFLDEVGELSLNAQKIFLRVLQEKRIRPVGEIREFASDFRLIAATNRDLPAMVEDNRFRGDLYFRLKTMEIHLPPLRQRQQDITLLAVYRAGMLAQQYGVARKSLDPELLEHLRQYHWPGNVRELFGVLETAFVAAWDSDVLYPSHLPKTVRIAVARRRLDPPRPETSAPASGPVAASAPEPPDLAPCLDKAALPSLKEFKGMMEKRYLESLSRQAGGDVERMCGISDLSRSHLYALMKKHGVGGKE